MKGNNISALASRNNAKVELSNSMHKRKNVSSKAPPDKDIYTLTPPISQKEKRSNGEKIIFKILTIFPQNK